MVDPYETVESVVRLIKRTLGVQEWTERQDEAIRMAIGGYGQHEAEEAYGRGQRSMLN